MERVDLPAVEREVVVEGVALLARGVVIAVPARVSLVQRYPFCVLHQAVRGEGSGLRVLRCLPVAS